MMQRYVLVLAGLNNGALISVKLTRRRVIVIGKTLTAIAGVTQKFTDNGKSFDVSYDSKPVIIDSGESVIAIMCATNSLIIMHDGVMISVEPWVGDYIYFDWGE